MKKREKKKVKTISTGNIDIHIYRDGSWKVRENKRDRRGARGYND